MTIRDLGSALRPQSVAVAGVARVSCGPDHRMGEYALIVRSDLQGRGIFGALLHLLIDYARADGLERLEGPVLDENRVMLDLVRRLGFEIDFAPDDPGLVSRLMLRPSY